MIRNGKALISDRIFRENPQCTDRHQLIANIESVLDTEMLLVPQIHNDMTGHVDGYMRWYTDDTVLLTQPDIEHAYVLGNRDEEVIRLFESLFPQLTVVPIVMNNIARAGGLIHCVTWEG